MEKEMATHASSLAWKIQWTEKPGRLQSMGSQRVRHDWATSLSLYPQRKCYDKSRQLEKVLESPLDFKEIKPVNPKGNQPWIFIGRTDAEAEAPIFWPPNMKNWLFGKGPDAGKDWRQKGKAVAENEMVGWHHQLNRHESEQTLGGCEGRGSLECYGPRGRKESDPT